MRQGGTIIGLYLNPENADISVDYGSISVRLAIIPSLAIFSIAFLQANSR
jgi:hypothetical protein